MLEQPDGVVDRGDQRVASVHLMYAVTRDSRLRDELLAHYDRFAVRLARTFASRREEREDLVQVARVGLIHAVDRFDPTRERPFVAFAHVTIMGELKRHVRDHTWRIKVPRTRQEAYLVVVRTADDLTQELGRSPRIAEIAARAGLTEEQVLEAMEVIRSAAPLSLDQPVEADGATLEAASEDPAFDRVEQRQTLQRALTRLPQRDQQVVRLRFDHELTQSQIAARLGVSQMGISRSLTRTFQRMRTHLADDDRDTRLSSLSGTTPTASPGESA